jgi:hypothetical protein
MPRPRIEPSPELLEWLDYMRDAKSMAGRGLTLKEMMLLWYPPASTLSRVFKREVDSNELQIEDPFLSSLRRDANPPRIPVIVTAPTPWFVDTFYIKLVLGLPILMHRDQAETADVAVVFAVCADGRKHLVVATDPAATGAQDAHDEGMTR